MTLRTFGAIFALVTVILLVTAKACHRGLFDAVACAVTSRTSGAGMGAQQGKAGFCAMVELRILPTARRVTVRTGRSSGTFMRVILCMAGNTGLLRFPDRIIGTVAPCTGCPRMLAK